MKYDVTESFLRDVRDLKKQEKYDDFKDVVDEKFIPAAQRIAEDSSAGWTNSLRVKTVEGAAGVFEMSWDHPDGRATFEIIDIKGEMGILWRRVGTHSIFSNP